MKIPEDYSCHFCTKKLNLSNCHESAIHHCHECGLIIDLICRACNALERRKISFRNRFIFGFEIQVRGPVMGKIPYKYEFGKCQKCNSPGN